MLEKERILFEDNHLIAVNKRPGELSQGDETGDRTLIDETKEYLKKEYKKPGNVYLGAPHRLDRPTSGVILYCKTDKALSRMCDAFRRSEARKIYWAITDALPERDEGELVHWMIRDERNNKSIALRKERSDAKIARLSYRVLASADRYHLLEIELHTGRHHQIRSQLAAEGIHIKGDLKYGAARSNPDGGISLHARSILFVHPVVKKPLKIIAPPPEDALWSYFLSVLEDESSLLGASPAF